MYTGKVIGKLIKRARQLFYDNSSSGLAASNVQDAIDEISGSIPTLNAYSLNINANQLELIQNGSVIDTEDLSIYLDDTNLSRIISGSLDASGIATFNRDDASSFTVDFSQFFDNTNLSRIVSGNVVGNNIVLTRDDASDINIDISSVTTSFEGYTESGTRAGGDLIVGLGDHDFSGNGTSITIDDANQEVIIDTQGGGILKVNGEIESSVNLGITNGSNKGTILADNVSGFQDYQLPTTGGTLAKLSDIPTLNSYSLNIAANQLQLLENGSVIDSEDLSIYLDDTNLSRIVSGTLDGAGIATFTRDDASSFTVDFSPLFDDTNLARIVSGNVSGTDLILTRDNATDITIDVSSLISSASVQGVTGNIVDNTDPLNPVIDETITTLTDNQNGTITHVSEDGTSVTTQRILVDVSGTGTVDLTGTAFQVLDLGTDNLNSGSLFTNTAGVLTYTGATAIAKLSYSISAVNNETATRSNASHALFVNGNQLVRSTKYTYHRNDGDGFDSACFNGVLTLNNGDTIDLRSSLVGGATDDVDILLEQTNLFIEIQ